jgi:branched-chain amino acid aminotransferase
MRGTHDALPDERNKDVEVFINGEFFHRDEAKISVFDGGYLVGDGVWEGIRLHGGKFAFLELHLERLFEGAKAIGLDIGKTKAQLTEMLYGTVRRNDMHDNVHVRLMVTRGNKKTPSQDPRLTVTPPNPEVTKAGIKLFTSSTRRPPPDTLDARLNCHSKLHEVIALIQALNAGADEALMLDVNGAVATCNATNFFIVTQGEVWTSTGQHCLNGITRRLVIELCKANAISVQERDFSLTKVYNSEEAFVTGTFGSLTPVIAVDGRTIGTGQPGEMTARLSRLYKEAVAEATRG